jgi:rhodanese-related sulfurtransferase
MDFWEDGRVGSSAVVDRTVLDVPVNEAWVRLKADRAACLIDVRTRSEWAFVGSPDLSKIGKDVLAVEWLTFPDNQVDAKFADRLHTILQSLGVGRDDELFFICRSGGRSRAAAEAMAAVGFEGPLDRTRHRGTVAGWKAAGLPWVQS